MGYAEQGIEPQLFIYAFSSGIGGMRHPRFLDRRLLRGQVGHWVGQASVPRSLLVKSSISGLMASFGVFWRHKNTLSPFPFWTCSTSPDPSTPIEMEYHPTRRGVVVAPCLFFFARRYFTMPEAQRAPACATAFQEGSGKFYGKASPGASSYPWRVINQGKPV